MVDVGVPVAVGVGVWDGATPVLVAVGVALGPVVGVAVGPSVAVGVNVAVAGTGEEAPL